MAELIWLDGYSGQTVDELLALEGSHRVDSLLLAFEEAINRKAARVGEDNLPMEERIVLVVEALEREVNNGGYDQFFVNSMEYAPFIVEALQRIGCPKMAAITQRAIAALQLPVVSIEEIEKVIYDDNDRRDKILGECDGQYYDYPESIENNLLAYIKANRGKITL